MQSQLDNTRAHHKDSMATNTDAMTMTAIWHSCSIDLIELLFDKIVDNYSLWSYAIQKKLETDVSIYVTKQQCIRYALSRMKSLLFDKIAV